MSDKESMLDMFIFEMNQLLDQLEQLIIECETGYSSDNINEIFRIMHTVKGSAAMMMFDGMSKTAHAVEDLFFFLREENPTISDYSKLTDVILEGMDFIKGELIKISEGTEANDDPTLIIKSINEFLKQLKDEQNFDNSTQNEKNVNSNNVPNVLEEQNLQENYNNTFKCTLFFEKDCGMENVRALNVINNLKQYGHILSTTPENVMDEASEEIIQKDGFKFLILTDIEYKEIYDIINETIYLKEFEISEYSIKKYEAFIIFDDGCEMENIRAFTIVHNLKELANDIETNPKDLTDENNTEFIRKNGFKISFTSEKDLNEINTFFEKTAFIKKLELKTADQIQKENENNNEQNEKSDLDKNQQNDKAKTSKETKKSGTQQMISISVNKLDKLLNLMGELVIAEAMTTQNPDLNGLNLENFNKSARQLRKIIKDVQDNVMSMRMVTLDATFFKMQRIVRDMCKALNKNVELIIEGGDTEADKNIIEHISDPLMHIIRNSVDHGIELPEVRVKNNKPEKGTIKLEAKNSGGEILIIVKDDGIGINKKRVLEKAKNAGILKKHESEYTDREICQLIFHAGLSTKETVTNYSGRGVGMDVVTANIEQVGGNIIVESEEGYGTTTILKIPLTLSIIDGMLITMGGAKYTIPISSIKETFKAKKENIFFDPDGNEMITVRNDVYNVVRLYEFFDVQSDIKDIEEGVIIIIENGASAFCLFVDELIGEQPVVVKSIPKYIKKINGISGCTLLGNGDISLIIDVSVFFEN